MIGFIPPFRILDYLDRLNVVKTTPVEYHCTCPACGDGGFKIDRKSGKYKGFKCSCDVKDIREAIRPWSEVKESQTDNSHQPNRKKVNRKSKSKKATSAEIELALLPEIPTDSPQAESGNIPNWLQDSGVPAEAVETRYWYSKTQWVSRFEWSTFEGKQKTIRQGHIKSNGLIQWKKGSKDWFAYKLTEAAKHCADKWVLAFEGEGCVGTARGKAITGITWQGSNWNEKTIACDLTKLNNAGAKGIVYFPDLDSAGDLKAELVLSACQSINFPCLILSPTDVWAEMPEKGDITDFVEAHPQLSTDELVSKLEKAIAIAVEKVEKEKEAPNDGTSQSEKANNLPEWSQSDIADWLAEKYEGQLAWNTDSQEWYRYGLTREGIWGKGSTERIGKLVKSELKTLAYKTAKSGKKKPSYTISFVNGVTALLKFDLEVDKWNELQGLLPMLNGVLDLESRKLLSHSPENRLTWCLPYEYNMFATCEPIQDWLLTMCDGDRNLVQLMRAFLLGIVTGRTDWQKYLELVGAGGTGKSSFVRLATALVGIENVHTTTLHKLEKCRFETASIAGKKLVSVNDSERYAGSVTKLKNLTGQDTLPFEVKFKQSKGGFTPSAMVIVSTNEAIQSSDYTSGLERRRISVPMNNKIKSDRQKNLIEHKNGKMYGEFLPYIPGLLNWVLAMDESEATSIVKNYEVKVPSLFMMKANTLVETNPIADWLDTFIIHDPEAETNIGVAKRDKDNSSATWYLDTDKWLYPNYCEYCHNSGTKAVSLRRFVSLLSDLGKNQLGLDIRRERNRFGAYFVGLKIRNEFDSSPPMITGNTEVIINTKVQVDNTNVLKDTALHIINRLWTMVMEKVTDVLKDTAPHIMDYVMDESIDNVDCDSSDGKNQKSRELENNVEIKTDCPKGYRSAYNTVISSETEFSSKSSPEDSQSTVEQQTRDKDKKPSSEVKTVITVGDRVEIEDCPGHWSSFSPFTVEAIEGELVKLEMVGELVEIERLAKE